MVIGNDEWLAPLEALSVLEPRHGAATKNLIADKLKDGLIRAKAELLWDSFEPNLDAVWSKRDETLKSGEETDIETDVEIESWLWRSSRHWEFDLSNWRWPDDRFVVTRQKKPADRTIIEGLKLLKSDVLELAKPPSKRVGRKANYSGWANFVEVLIQFERSGWLTKERFPTYSSLEKAVLDRIAQSDIPNADRLDEDTMKRTAHAVWDRVIRVE